MDSRRHPLLLLGALLLGAGVLGMPSGCIVGILAPEDAGADAAGDGPGVDTGSSSGASGGSSGTGSSSGSASSSGGSSGSSSGASGSGGSSGSSSGGGDAGCSPNLSTDAMNCGRCGHVCDPGMMCSGGTCAPKTLRTGSGTVSDLRTVGSQLFWMEGLAGLYWCTLPDCSSVTTVVSGTTLAGYAVSGSTAFVVEGVITNAVVRAYGTDGSGAKGDLTVALQGLKGPMDVDSTNVFYTARDGSGSPFFGYLPQNSSSATATDVTTYISNFQVQMRVASGGGTEYAFWSDGSSLIRCPTANSSTPTTLGMGNGITGLAVDSQYVFWTASGDGKVIRCDGTGANCSPILQGQATPSRVAVDTTGIAWANAASGLSGTVSECTYPDCGGAFLLAQGQASPSELAMDATYVYWATGATIWRVPR